MLGKQLKDLENYFGKDSSNEKIIEGFAVDSRKVKPGFVFFALRGGKVDGHDFLIDAFKNGAIAAVVSSKFTEKFPGHTLLYVYDVLDTLQTFARDVLSTQNKRIVAITGSMGKTTTKEFAATILSAKYKVFKTPGNANSQIGLPLSLLNRKDLGEEIMVLEMGMMDHGQIERLVEIAPPEVAVITKIAPAHLEFFHDGLKGIAEAKSEILSHPNTNVAFINFSAFCYESISFCGDCGKTYYSLERNGTSDHWMESQGSQIRICSDEEKSPWLTLPFEAPQLRENFIAAALVARYFKIAWEEIASACSKLTLFEKRFEKIERDGVIFINDSYNANPESMKFAIANLPRPENGGRTIFALGHMVELGSYCQPCHREIGEYADRYGDRLFCLGEKCLPMKEAFAKSGKPVEHFEDLKSMQKSLFAEVKKGDVVLIKASNSVGLWRILESL
ncbi:MAG: UDP-N-acetylmuramoyl-tripeptide--D-alanyl-D-alanine ligase [Chlamydiae bacterium]|nr:UDP-N-acetylmuramoyl-tripeptide--D-alanyl-D-alanine ligase [Chlamydiota bacterium]